MLDGPLLRVTCANRRKTGFTPGRAAVCVLSALPPNARLSVQGMGQRSQSLRTSAITAVAALATLGQCEHWLSLVGRCPTSNTGIIARLTAVVKPEFVENGPLTRSRGSSPGGRAFDVSVTKRLPLRGSWRRKATERVYPFLLTGQSSFQYRSGS